MLSLSILARARHWRYRWPLARVEVVESEEEIRLFLDEWDLPAAALTVVISMLDAVPR
jgi:hypothetical protein